MCDLFTCTRTRHCIAATPSFDSAVAAFRSTWDMYGFDTHCMSTHVFNLTPLLRQFSNPFTHLSFLNSLLARGVLWKPVDNGSGYRLHLVSRSIPHHSWVVWLFSNRQKCRNAGDKRAKGTNRVIVLSRVSTFAKSYNTQFITRSMNWFYLVRINTPMFTKSDQKESIHGSWESDGPSIKPTNQPTNQPIHSMAHSLGVCARTSL